MLPIMIDLKDKNVLVIGGGRIAARKIKTLLEEDAIVTVVSQKITHEIKSLYGLYVDKLKLIEEEYIEHYINNNYSIVIGATNDRELNKKIAKTCKYKKVLCNIIDSKNLSDITFVSVVKRGDLSIGISTNGKSPSLSIKIKKQIENVYGPEYEEYVSLLGEIREKVIISSMDQSSKKEMLTKLIEKNIKELREIKTNQDE